MSKLQGRVTVPTDRDIVPETLATLRRWGADAVRDCDGTELPPALAQAGVRVYATYYTTRKDNAWAKANPDERQQCYLMSAFTMAKPGAALRIPLLQGISPELMAVNGRDDPARWWEVIDRTAGTVVPPACWRYEAEAGCVAVPEPEPWHEYTVSFLAYLIWDPVHMYNAVTNGWQDTEHQIPFDVRQPKTHAWSLQRLRRFCAAHPEADVIRFTTFFHQFTLVFDELRREKYVDWYGYSASVSPYILTKFEREAGYPFRPEYIIDQGYYNNQYRTPSPQYKDFMAFQRREVAALVREFTDIVHEYGKQAMMFLGDHWIGTEPYMPEFAGAGVDAVVGSVGNASTLRLIADIPGLQYTEGRLLPYFFPDTFRPGGDPAGEARRNWLTARRALLRRPLDRIGYGGYLRLALQFPDFMAYAETVCDEFRALYAKVHGAVPWCAARVAVLNAWGRMRAWGCHMVHHALYYKKNYSYAGVIEALAGAALDVQFLSFDDLKADPDALRDVDVVFNIGDGDTAHTGSAVWEDAEISACLRRFVCEGGGLIGIGEPGGHPYQGRYLQLGPLLGVEKETGCTLGYDKYNWQPHPEHFILGDTGPGAVDFGEGHSSIYALPGAAVLIERDGAVQLAANICGEGRGVYISGLPYTPANARLLYRAVLWAARKEDLLHRWNSDTPAVEVHAYPQNGRWCAVNNSETPQTATVWDGDGQAHAAALAPGEIRWYES